MAQELLAETAERSTKQAETRGACPVSAPPARTGVHPLLRLQRTIGNRRVAQLIQARRLTPQGIMLPVQPKLTVGAADDEYEQEADRIAKQVIAMPPPDVRRPAPLTRDALQHDEEDGSGGNLATARITPLRRQPIQSESAESGRESFEADASPETQLTSTKRSDNEELPMRRVGSADQGRAEVSRMRKENHLSTSAVAPPSEHETSRSSGQPLDSAAQENFEASCAYSPGIARIHADRPAVQSAREAGALAHTVGWHAAFSEGRYSWASAEGRRLLADESTHVVRQQRGPVSPYVARQPKQAAPPPVSCSFNCTDPAFTGLDTPGREARFNMQCPQGYPKGTTFFGQPIPSASSAKLKSKLVEAEAKAKQAMCLNGKDPGAYTLDRRIITYARHSPAKDRAVDIDVMGQPYVMHERKRSSTVANLPAGLPTGSLSYVTDGETATDCTVGQGSRRVLCAYNGTAWAYARGVGDIDQAIGPVYDRIMFWKNHRKSIIPTSIKTVELGRGGGASRTWTNPETGVRKEGVTTGELYDKLKTESDAMKDYFSLLLKSDTDLGNALNTFLATNTASAADLIKRGLPTGHSAADVQHFQQAIADDYLALGGSKAQLQSFAGRPIARASHTPKPVIGNRPFASGAVEGATLKNGAPDPDANRRPELGFIVLPKEVVVALTEVGLAWGAIDFGAESGDVMHFDCRHTSC